MLPLKQLKVESPDGRQESSSSFIPRSDNEPSLFEISHEIRPFSESTPIERIFKHDRYRNGNKNSVAGFTEYENVTVHSAVAANILNSTFNNVSERLEKPEVLEDPGSPLVDDQSEPKEEIDSRIPVKSHGSATGKMYNLETENAQAFFSAAALADNISVTTKIDDDSKAISVTAETNLPSVPEIALPSNKNISFAPISDVTAESNSFGLVSKKAINFSNLGFLPATTDDYPEFSDTIVPFVEGSTEFYVPVTEESVETLLPTIDDDMKSVASNTEEHVENVVAVTGENIETAVPVTEHNTETIVPVTEEITETVVPVTEEITETAVPVTEEITETSVSVTEENTETAVPVTEEITETVVPVTEEITETVVPITEEITETVVPVTDEITETVVPVTEVKTYTTVNITDENTDIYAPIKDENTDIYVPITDENKKILELAAEDNTEAVMPVTMENKQIYESSTEENTATDNLVTERISDPAGVIIESKEKNVPFGIVNKTGSVKDAKDSAVLVIDENTQTVQIATDDLTDKVPIDVPDSLLNNLKITGINNRIQSNSSTLESKLSVNSTETPEHNVVLAASPRMEVLQSTLSAPFEPATFDVKIKTIKDLQADVHDILFDPSQIAKATSYEESSYSTATRSATVTTWVDPNNRNIIGQGYTNLTQLRGTNTNSKQIVPSAEETKSVIPRIINVSEHHTNLEITASSPIATSNRSNQLHGMEVTAVPIGYTYNDLKENYSRQEDISFVNKTVTDGIDSNIGDNGTSAIPVLKLNVGDFGNVSGTSLQSGESNAGNSFIYEMPDLNRNSGLHMTSSVVIALSICCSVVVILSILTVSLWLRRRHKNRSKIYLSQESVKPRAFFTKPMNPALLPNERLDMSESLYVMEFQKPRAPVVLSDDPDCVNCGGETILESQTNGIENHAFVDIPLEDLKPKNLAKGHITQNPPKPGSKSLPESDLDCGIKVWSSTGSLYRASPELCHCPVPPPPYLSSSGDELINLSLDTLPSLGSKSRLLYV